MIFDPTNPSLPRQPSFLENMLQFLRKFMTKISGIQSLGPDVCTTSCEDLTDVTLADKDINSNLTDNANKAIQDNLTTSGGQILTKYKFVRSWL